MPPVKRLYVALTAVFSAHLKNFCLVEAFYQLSVYRLSEEMCTFAHGYVVLWQKQR
jgi:hypothetical protein